MYCKRGRRGVCGGDGVCGASDCLLHCVGAVCVQLTCMACMESCCPEARGQIEGGAELMHDANALVVVDVACMMNDVMRATRFVVYVDCDQCCFDAEKEGRQKAGVQPAWVVCVETGCEGACGQIGGEDGLMYDAGATVMVADVVCVVHDDTDVDPLQNFFGETHVATMIMLMRVKRFGVNELTCGAVGCCCDVCDVASGVSCACCGCCCCGCCGGNCMCAKCSGVAVCCVVDSVAGMNGCCEND